VTYYAISRLSFCQWIILKFIEFNVDEGEDDDSTELYDELWAEIYFR
jgi:hypothetical protein